MAITRAQQFKQMLAQGGRIGLRGGGADMGKERGPETGREPGPVGGGKGIGGNGGNTNRERGIMRSIPQAITDIQRGTLSDPREKQDVFERPSKLSFLDFVPGIGTVRRIARTFGPLDNKKFFEDKVVPSLLDRGMKVPTFENYMKLRMSNQTDAYGNPIDQDDDDNNIMLPQTMFARQTPSITKEEEEEKDNFNFRLLAEGGRAGFQEGGIMPRLNQLGSGVSSAEQTLQEINQRLESAESSLGGGGAMQQPTSLASDVFTSAGVTGGPQVSNLRDAYANAQKQAQESRKLMPNAQVVLPGEMSFEAFSKGFNPFNPSGLLGNQFSQFTPPETPVAMQTPLSGIPAAGYADGGDVVGGEFDFESARQMYGLGKLVKKVTRTVKKIAKSPIGKAALAFGAYKLGGMGFGKSNLSLFERFGNLTALQKLE